MGGFRGPVQRLLMHARGLLERLLALAQLGAIAFVEKN
jgi:hypothetical protein